MSRIRKDHTTYSRLGSPTRISYSAEIRRGIIRAGVATAAVAAETARVIDSVELSSEWADGGKEEKGDVEI